MKVINIINLKGGVAKTISAVNMAYLLAAKHAARVLLIDNDKQGNASKFFGLHSYASPSIAEVLTEKDFDIRDAITKTEYDGLDVLPANMNLLRADREIMLDMARPQQTRLKNALRALDALSVRYDYAVIDNAPDITMSTINALVACDDVLIPIKIDKFAFDGLEQLIEQIVGTREFNPQIKIAGCFVTMYSKNNVNTQGVEWLGHELDVRLYETAIRKTVIVDESTFAGKPLSLYAPNSTAAQDYEALVDEYLKNLN